VQWRNEALEFENVGALIASLERAPARPGLLRVRGADDELVLRRALDDAELTARVRDPDNVRRLWEACQLPDFRKLSKDEHVQLALRIAGYIVAPQGRAPSHWVEAEIKKVDTTAGDLDQLQARLATIRTWTYAASRPDWLEDADDWRIKTREVEDKLS